MNLKVCGIMTSNQVYLMRGNVTTLLLIRHATNDWIKGRLPGWKPGIHLNDEGRHQAQQVAERLASLPIAAIYSSPLERATETAQIIAAPHHLRIRIVEDIGEVRYGDWTGAHLADLYQEQLWAGIQFYPSHTRIPGGETLGEVQLRAIQALNALRDMHAQDKLFVAVSHADVIRLVTAYYIGIHIDLFQRLIIHPASLTALRFEPMGPRLLAFNETGSLDHLMPTEETSPSQSNHQEQQPKP
jgi:probable phosphoglycerate mutase